MSDKSKAKEQLINGLSKMRQRISEVEALETQHKQAIEESKDFEQPYSMLIEVANNLGEGIAIVQDIENKQGAIVFTNDAATKILGYTREELLQMSLHDLVPHTDVQGLIRRYRRRQSGEKTEENYETLILAKDGVKVPMQVELRSTTYQGKPSVICFIRNITERNQAEEALQNGEEHFQALIENAFDTIIILNADGSISYASSSIKRFLEYEPEELIGKSVFSFIHPEILEKVTGIFYEGIKIPGYVTFLELKVQHKDGSWRTAECVGTNLLDHPSVAGVVVNLRDITDRKQAEEALQQSNERFQALIENSFDTVVIINADGSIGYASPSLKRTLGYEPEEWIGKNLFDFAHPDDMQKIIDLFEGKKDIPDYAAFMELRARHKDGSWRTIEGVGANLLYHPSITGIVANFRDITDRMEIAEALQNNKEYFQALIENTFDTIIVLNSDGSIGYVSPSIKRTLGYEPEEWIGKNILSFIHPDKFSVIINIIIEGKQTPGYVGFLEMPMQHKDGSWRVIEGTGTNLLANPSIKGIVASFHDITETRQTEKRYKELIEDINDGYIVYQDDKIVLANQRFVDIFGYTMDQVLGQNFTKFIAPDALREAVEIYRRAESSNENIGQYEMKAIKGDGTEIMIDLNGKAVEYEGKHAYSVIFRDITERRQMEEKYRQLVDGISEGYAVIQDGNVVFANKRIDEIFGYKTGEIIGQPFVNFLAPESVQSTMEKYTNVMHGEEELADQYEGMGVKKDGTRVIIEASGKFTLYEGKPAFSLIVRDVTERKKMEEALRRSNEELQQFAYVASHDLQEPLRMVSSYVQLLGQRYQGKLDADADDFIGYAVDGAYRMQKLITDLLTYSRIGTQGKEFEPIDCETVFERAISNLQPAIEESGAVLTHDTLPTVTADATQLSQVFQNLIGNAIKFRSKELPHVHVSAEKKGNEWLFSVSDNGIGIDPQYHDRIFIMFQRLHGRGEYPGTGIGLTICRRIVERHGGRIWVESEHGKGATFYFTIPS